MYKYIIFDFNGTLLDDVKLSLDDLNFCVHKYINKNKNVSLNDYLNHFMFPVSKYYESVGFDFKKINFKDLANDFISYYQKRYAKQTSLYKNVIKTLSELKKQNYTLIILTASFKELLNKQLEYFKIDNYIDVILAQENNYANSKEEIALNYFKLNNIDPTLCLYIGDTVHDYEVSKILNIKCLSFSSGHNSKELLSKHNKDYLIDDIYDIFKYLNK